MTCISGILCEMSNHTSRGHQTVDLVSEHSFLLACVWYTCVLWRNVCHSVCIMIRFVHEFLILFCYLQAYMKADPSCLLKLPPVFGKCWQAMQC